MATSAPSSRSPHSWSAAAERVVPSFGGKLRDLRIAEGAHDVVPGGETGAGDAVRHHRRVAQDRRPALERAPRRFDKAGSKFDRSRHVDLSAGMDHAHGDRGLLSREAGEVGLGADDGEGALIDGAPVAEIVGGLKH